MDSDNAVAHLGVDVHASSPSSPAPSRSNAAPSSSPIVAPRATPVSDKRIDAAATPKVDADRVSVLSAIPPTGNESKDI